MPPNTLASNPLALAALALLILAAACGPSKTVAEAEAEKARAAAEPPEAPPEPPKPAFKAEIRGADGREMSHVPAGPFLRGSKVGVGTDEERPQKTLALKGFWIDRNEVSVGDWTRCLKAGPCSNDKLYRQYRIKDPDKRPEPCNYGQPDRDAHPMNCVSWFGAEAYCKWAGKRLPTEAEWEKAARGTDGRLYPWGEEKADCSRACMVDKSMYGCGTRTSCPIGSRGQRGMSPYGAFDMSGNVYEWVANFYSQTYYQDAPTENPFNSARDAQRPVRGGAFSSDEDGARAAKRSAFNAVDRVSFVGFRCASDE